MAITWVRRHPLVTAVGAVVVLAIIGVTAFAFAGGFDDTTTTRVSGRGAQVVRVALVDRAVGFDVTPDVIEVEEGTHVVLDVVNEGQEQHDLAIADGGPRTPVLDPGDTERLDLGVVSADGSGRCTIGDHDTAGMTVAIELV